MNLRKIQNTTNYNYKLAAELFVKYTQQSKVFNPLQILIRIKRLSNMNLSDNKYLQHDITLNIQVSLSGFLTNMPRVNVDFHQHKQTYEIRYRNLSNHI